MAADLELAERIAGYLNGVLAHDRRALHELVQARVPCGKCLATHPTVQVMRVDDDTMEYSTGYYLGLMGLLNGLCGVLESGPRKGCGPLFVEMNEQGDIARFRVSGEGEEA